MSTSTSNKLLPGHAAPRNPRVTVSLSEKEKTKGERERAIVKELRERERERGRRLVKRRVFKCRACILCNLFALHAPLSLTHTNTPCWVKAITTAVTLSGNIFTGLTPVYFSFDY